MSSVKTHPPVLLDTPKVGTVLQTLYHSVKTLEDWLVCLDTTGALRSSLHADELNTAKGYTHLVTTTLVAEKENSKKIRTPVSLEQVSHQHELLVRSVQRVLKRDGPGSNILSFGFGPMTDNPRACVTYLPNLEYRYPNSSISRLQHKVWTTLLSRIGDDLMSHLLENTSLFVLMVKPAVYLQVTGEPVFQLWPYAAGTTYPAKMLSSYAGKKNSVKRKSKQKGKLYKQSKQSHMTKTSGVDCQTASQQPKLLATSGKETALGFCTRTVSQPSTQKRQALSDNDFVSKSKMKKTDIELASELKRRKICDDNVAFKCKKQKKQGGETEEATLSERCNNNPKSVVQFSGLNTDLCSQSGMEDNVLEVSDDAAAVTASINTSLYASAAFNPAVRETDDDCIEVNTADVGATEEINTSLLASNQEAEVSTTVGTDQRLQHQDMTNIQHSHHRVTLEESEINCSSTGVIGEQFADSNHDAENVNTPSSLKSKRQRKRIRDNKKAKLQRACSPGIFPYKHHQYVPRLSLLYGKTFTQKFPKNFNLTDYSESDEGGKLLFTDIFVKGSVGGNLSSSSQSCQCQQSAAVSITLDEGVHNLTGVEGSCNVVSNRKPVNNTQIEKSGQNGHADTRSTEIEMCTVKNLVVTEVNLEIEMQGKNVRMAQEESEVETCGKNQACPSANTQRKGIQLHKVMEQDHICSTKRVEDKDEGTDCSNTNSLVERHDEGIKSAEHTPRMHLNITDQEVKHSTEENAFRDSQHAIIPTVTGIEEQVDVKNTDLKEKQERRCNTASSQCATYDGDISSSNSSSSVPCGQTSIKRTHKDSLSGTLQTFPKESTLAVTSVSHLRSPVDISVAETSPETKQSPMSSVLTVRSPLDILMADTPPGLRPSSQSSTVRSPMDIIMAETSPGSKSSSAPSSASAVISDVTSVSNISAHQPPHEHSSFYSDGSYRDRTLANLNMTAFQMSKQSFVRQNDACTVSHSVNNTCQAPQELLSGSKDRQECVGPTVALSARKETPRQAEETGLKTMHCEPRPFALNNATQQKEVRAKNCAPIEPDAESTMPGVLPYLQSEVRPLLQLLLHNHRKCNYRALLEHYCQSKCDRTTDTKTVQKTLRRTNTMMAKSSENPLDLNAGRVNKLYADHCRKETRLRHHKRCNRKAFSTPKLLEDYIQHSKVSAFLQAVVKRTVPEKLIGTGANMSRLINNIKTIISAGKFEKMHLGQMMIGMKVKDCIWLRKVACPLEKQQRLAQLVWWIVVCFMFPVIRAFFYLTDTCIFRTRILYYRKSVWLKLQMRAMNEFRKSIQLQPISEARVNEMLSSRRSLGVSVLRFVPKTRSLRPIVNMSRKPNPALGQKQAINKQLTKLFQILNFEKTLDVNLCGYSAFGIDEVYKKLKQFKEYRASVCDNRSLYFVKTDVSKCFDSIKQELLFTIVKDILTKEGEQSYMTRKYARVYSTGREVKRVFHSDTTRLTHYQPDFGCFLRQMSKGGKLTDIIVVDQAYYQQTTTASLMEALSSHLFRNVIKMGRRHYLQCQGISQGSILSTLLANIYLAHLEATHLETVHDELLVRWMDDYLFLTPDRSHAEHFLETSVKGFPDYNIFTNVEKILTNFPVQLPPTTSIMNTEQGDPFPWCGLLIDTNSLEVSVDYSRYSGLCMTDTATFDICSKPGKILRIKLIRCMKIKCNAIFFDPLINSRERILVNAFQVMLFLARTFHSFVTKLPASRRVENNPRFFIKTVDLIPGHLLSFVTRKLKQAECQLGFPVQLQTLQWLNADAFLLRLNQYPGYKPLKTSLRAKRQSLGRKLGVQEVSLLKAVHHTGMKLDSNIVVFP